MVFHAADLLARCTHGPAVQYWVVNNSTPAVMGPIDLQGTWWIIAFNVEQEKGEQTARALIDGAAGAPVEARVLSNDPWTARMQLVDRARSGRVFLAGDAAHLNPPFGGHGLNTGIGDAIDLGWKLAATLQGWGGALILDSYEAERRPVQIAVIEEAVANMRVLANDLLADDIDAPGEAGERARRLADANIQATKHAEFHSLSLVLDLAYESSPIIDEAQTPDVSPGTARPGGRLPHAWIKPGISLYDELGDGMTLLVLAHEHARDVAAIAAAARDAHVPLRVLDLPDHRLTGYGAELVLVRPDQYVAWCADEAPENPRALIDRVRGAAPALAH
jgi:GNAT superfamily N-acetyltransferase